MIMKFCTIAPKAAVNHLLHGKCNHRICKVTCVELGVGSDFYIELQLLAIITVRKINWKSGKYVLFELKVESLPI
jgi:hypothetical protein